MPAKYYVNIIKVLSKNAVFKLFPNRSVKDLIQRSFLAIFLAHQKII